MGKTNKVPKDTDRPKRLPAKSFKKYPRYSVDSGHREITQWWRSKTSVTVVLLSVAVAALSAGYVAYGFYRESRVVTPLDAPLVNVSQDPGQFWGSYRSTAYFGMRTMDPQSPVLGLMWFPQLVANHDLHIRHWCDQGDSLRHYSWQQHDGRSFGVQNIWEEDFTLTTSFLKRLGGDYGGDWTARISVAPKENATLPYTVSLMFYLALDGPGEIHPVVERTNHLKTLHGSTPALGNFQIHFKSETSSWYYHNFLLTAAPPGYTHLKEVVKSTLQRYKNGEVIFYGLRGHVVNREPENQRAANFAVYQVTFTPPLDLEIIFESESFKGRPNQLSGLIYEEELRSRRARFSSQFEEVFQLKKKGYSEGDIQIAQSIFSNMIGSVGYFYGSSVVQSIHNKKPLENWAAPLLTAVPSRSFFPRGFLWDEGFHNLLISRWDPDLTKNIMAHWLNLMNVEGWIPREQILGHEARERVPKEFVIQKNTNANPPTFFLTLENMLARMHRNEVKVDKEYLEMIFPRVKAWFDWFNTTQVGNMPGAYRWRGRDPVTRTELNPKTLTSGLDDYPRASHPTSVERHVDLRSWMCLAAKVLSQLAQERPPPPKIVPGQPQPRMDKIRIILSQPKLRFVDQYGYVSLFPFLLKIIKADNPKLLKVLTDLKNPELLWTDYGLRSLARSSSLYMKHNTEHDPPYWRGAIWINMNYLAIRALHHYAELPGPYQDLSLELYRQLRHNLVNTVLREYRRTGYIWENYSDRTGHGQGSHPFTGWSALVVLLMAELY
ncbi:MOGS [Cordylochernes scorpioides]|uniref:Mannosyl-oligosaccharide glucosidase n=1 Tax=Cordylochernes scorpioides TaxID=51811 RepID=A0ABY6JXQ0_9ARAC|nr:MOGS [Cordylochernes scorpioides]